MIDYLNTQQVHRKAMLLAQDAHVAQFEGDNTSALPLFSAAFDLEREAALDLTDDLAKEPTRSVLFRSAASLAMNCGRFEEGQAMVKMGLAGNPPHEIAEELREVSEKINMLKQKAGTPTTYITLIGILKIADAEKKYIKIVPTQGNKSFNHKINVTNGLTDMVKSFFDEVVSVGIWKKDNKTYELKAIEKLGIR
jgi:ankyrin repeat protein